MDNLFEFIANNGVELLVLTWEHLYISLTAVILGIIVAVPLGVFLTRLPRIADFVIGVAGVLQTFPSLAILAFLVPLLGIGKAPAIIALFIYSVLPILRNTYTGVKRVNNDLLEAGRGMGMSDWESIRDIEIPLSIPVIMAGIRVSTVFLIGWATIASYIGAGGLGDYIFFGLSLMSTEFILAGAIPVTLLALVTDLLLGRLERKLTPRGIRDSKSVA